MKIIHEKKVEIIYTSPSPVPLTKILIQIQK